MSSRVAWHEELRVFEANRRQKYSAKLDSCRLYWKSHNTLLQEGNEETERAHRLLVGVAQAQKVLASSLRSKKYVRKKKKEGGTLGFLESLNESTDAIKQHVNQSSQHLLVLDGKLKKLMQQSADGLEHLQGRGKSILDLMEKTQEQTVEAWDTYFESVKSSEAAASNPSLLAPIGPTKKPELASSSSSSDKKQDQWLAQVIYRSRVQVLLETWVSALEQLSKLFEAAQKVECRRRINLREYLIVFWKQQGSMLKQAEGAHTAPLTDWIEKDTTREHVEQDIKESIEKLQRAVQGLEDLNDDSFHTHFNNAFAEQDHKETSEVQPMADRLGVLSFYEELFTTGLDSDYSTHSCVVEVVRKTDLLSSSYALSVVTADGMLHLFMLKKKAKTPQEAFALILDRGSHEKEYSLRPDVSIDLNHVAVSMSSGFNKIEITSRPLAKQHTPSMTLIAATEREQVSLLNAIHGNDKAHNLDDSSSEHLLAC